MRAGCKVMILASFLWLTFLYLTVVGALCMSVNWWDPQAVLCKELNWSFGATFVVGLLVLVVISLFCLPLFFMTAVPSVGKCAACDNSACETVSYSILPGIIFTVVGIPFLVIAVVLFGWVKQVEQEWCSATCIPYDAHVVREAAGRRRLGGVGEHSLDLRMPASKFNFEGQFESQQATPAQHTVPLRKLDGILPADTITTAVRTFQRIPWPQGSTTRCPLRPFERGTLWAAGILCPQSRWHRH